MAKRTTQSRVSDSDDDDDTTSQSQHSSVIDVDDDEPPQKKAKGDDVSLTVAAFNKRYKVDTRTNEEVLGEFLLYPFNETFTYRPSRGAEKNNGHRNTTNTFASPRSLRRKES